MYPGNGLKKLIAFVIVISLAGQYRGSIDAAALRQTLDTPKSEGGATVPHTIFQFVAVPEDKMMWVKAPKYPDRVDVGLNLLFR